MKTCICWFFSQDDILKQALQNSGLEGTDKEETTQVDPKTGGKLSVMSVRDPATGAVKRHYVRKVGNFNFFVQKVCNSVIFYVRKVGNSAILLCFCWIGRESWKFFFIETKLLGGGQFLLLKY